MQLTHASNDGLARFFVGLNSERRVFCSQALQGNAHFFLVGFGFGFHGLCNDRLREHHALEHDDVVGIAQGFARGHIFQAHAGRNVAGANFIHLFAVVGVHLHNTANALFFTFNGVVHRVALFQDAGVNTHEGELTHKRIGHQLEGQ